MRVFEEGEEAVDDTTEGASGDFLETRLVGGVTKPVWFKVASFPGRLPFVGAGPLLEEPLSTFESLVTLGGLG